MMERSSILKIMAFSFFICAVSLVIVVASLLHLSSADPAPSREFDKGNGVVTNIWIESHARLETLRQNGVRYMFVDIGGTSENGLIQSTDRELEYFLNLVDDFEEETGHEFILLPYSEINAYNIAVTSDIFRQNFIEEYKRLYDLGFDGVLVDIEPARIEHRSHYLLLLDELQDQTDEDFIVSAYASPLVNDNRNPWVWERRFYSKVASKVDIISASGYDTDSQTEQDYRRFISNQVNELQDISNSNILFAVPTHKNFPEEISIALSEFRGAAVGKNPFLGLTVFAEWTASPEEWAIFAEYANSTFLGGY